VEKPVVLPLMMLVGVIPFVGGTIPQVVVYALTTVDGSVILDPGVIQVYAQ
jgi:hypothetical protein